MEGEVVGRRERKKLATRAALSEAAFRLSVEQGIERLTVEQISDEADVAVRTFFNHFSSKEQAVVAGDVGTAGSLATAFVERPADEPLVDALREAALAVIDGEAYRDRERIEQMRALRRAPALLPHQLAAYAEQERALAAAVAARTDEEPEQGLHPALVAAWAMAGLRVVLQSWLSAGTAELDRARLVELVDIAFTQLAAGLTTPVGPPGRAGRRRVALPHED